MYDRPTEIRSLDAVAVALGKSTPLVVALYCIFICFLFPRFSAACRSACWRYKSVPFVYLYRLCCGQVCNSVLEIRCLVDPRQHFQIGRHFLFRWLKVTCHMLLYCKTHYRSAIATCLQEKRHSRYGKSGLAVELQLQTMLLIRMTRDIRYSSDLPLRINAGDLSVCLSSSLRLCPSHNVSLSRRSDIFVDKWILILVVK